MARCCRAVTCSCFGVRERRRRPFVRHLGVAFEPLPHLVHPLQPFGLGGVAFARHLVRGRRRGRVTDFRRRTGSQVELAGGSRPAVTTARPETGPHRLVDGPPGDVVAALVRPPDRSDAAALLVAIALAVAVRAFRRGSRRRRRRPVVAVVRGAAAPLLVVVTFAVVLHKTALRLVKPLKTSSENVRYVIRAKPTTFQESVDKQTLRLTI